MNKYDLEKRTEDFGHMIVAFCKQIPKDDVTGVLINQLVRSGTSIGANYFEANAASSKKDFINKIHICKKEAQETCYWLRLFAKDLEDKKLSAQELEGEAYQLVLIFGKIISTSRNNTNSSKRS